MAVHEGLVCQVFDVKVMKSNLFYRLFAFFLVLSSYGFTKMTYLCGGKWGQRVVRKDPFH